MNWGHGIAIFFTCFVAFMLFLVVKSFQQNIDLVTENYYEQELRYQHQIDKIQNDKELSEKVKITTKAGNLELKFPLLQGNISGVVQVFRPSDARFDLEDALAIDAQNNHTIATNDLPPGYYKIKINWKSGDKEYYTEEAVHLR